MKILVVEDENALREVIVRSLEKERYVVESASSFRELRLYRIGHHASGR